MKNRRFKRWPARLRRAKLFDKHCRFLVDCRILDVSAGGARLKPDSDRPLPLELRYSDDADRDLAPVELIWMKQSDIGIRFLDQPDAALPTQMLQDTDRTA